MVKTKTIIFQGVTYRRYPNSKTRSERVYYMPNGTERAKGRKRYHQELWIHYNGLVPKGFVVHHADDNSLKNSLDNLELIERGEHQSNHSLQHFQDPKYVKRNKRLLDIIRPKSHAWRRTEQGKKWHSEHAKKTWYRREPLLLKCIGCGTEFFSYWKHHTKWCSRACINRIYQRKLRAKKRLQSNS